MSYSNKVKYSEELNKDYRRNSLWNMYLQKVGKFRKNISFEQFCFELSKK